jgi:hypothetical protein
MQIAASKFQLNTHAIGDSANTDFEDLQQSLAGTKTEDGKLTCPSVARSRF